MTLVRSGSVLAIGITIGISLLAQELLLRASADQIQVSAPRLHFISGKPLERLKNGNAVAFDFNLTVLNETKESILRRNFDRFVVSYDIWEEKFSVSRMRSGRSSAFRLSAEATEAWCLNNIAVSSSGLPPDRPLWIRLDIHAREDREQAILGDEEGLSLARLVELFSRAGKQEPNNWRLEAGPVRLADIRKTAGRVAF